MDTTMKYFHGTLPHLTGQNAEKIGILYWIFNIKVLVLYIDLGSCASSAIVWKQVFTETEIKCNVVIEINIGPWNKVQV